MELFINMYRINNISYILTDYYIKLPYIKQKNMH